jgi:benzoate/toluate 1,2-dioxygenase beta subunit
MGAVMERPRAPAPDRARFEAVRAFVEDEARLLDDRDFDDWLALFDEDCRYWVPVNPAMRSPVDGPAHFHDDKQVLMARTHRLLNPRAFGAEPSPRTAHVVSGIRIDRDHPDAAGGATLSVSSSQLMLEYRNRDGFENDLRVFGGRVTHTLRERGGRFTIAEKRVDLINAEAAFNAMLAPL